MVGGKGNPDGTPAVEPEVVDVGGDIRRWWQRAKPEDMIRQTTLVSAMQDLGVLSIGVLIQQLTSDQTDAKVKREIALATGTRLAIGLRAHLHDAPKHPGENVPTVEADAPKATVQRTPLERAYLDS